MDIPVLPGIEPRTITSARISTRVLFSGPADGIPVLFIHGNVSSATWWEECMLALPPAYRGIAHDQRGYGAADRDQVIDATRGLGDLADDAVALLDALHIDRAHIVGVSLGGAVIWRLLMDAPTRFRSAVLINPGSPFGFGGSKDETGTLCYPDAAGSGAGLVNPVYAGLMAAGERGADSPFAPRNALRGLFKQPFTLAREEEWLSALLSTHMGERQYPGDAVDSPNWPFKAPGVWGSNNALSPKYADDVNRLYRSDPKPPILWTRGADDQVVADRSLRDLGTLGEMGLVPGWPGSDVFPSQPMIGQTRAVLERYAAAGGWYREHVIADAGHVAYIEQPAAFNALFHAHLAAFA